MPSCASGAGWPFGIVSPDQEKLRYSKPSGSRISGSPVSRSRVGRNGPYGPATLAEARDAASARRATAPASTLAMDAEPARKPRRVNPDRMPSF